MEPVTDQTYSRERLLLRGVISGVSRKQWGAMASLPVLLIILIVEYRALEIPRRGTIQSLVGVAVALIAPWFPTRLLPVALRANKAPHWVQLPSRTVASCIPGKSNTGSLTAFADPYHAQWRAGATSSQTAATMPNRRIGLASDAFYYHAAWGITADTDLRGYRHGHRPPHADGDLRPASSRAQNAVRARPVELSQ
jgi:hypothetical protein